MAFFYTNYSISFQVFLAILAIIVVTVLKNWIRNLKVYFQSGFSGPFPLPLVGNLMGLMIKGVNANYDDCVKKYGKTTLVYEGTGPTILTADPELIKTISIKEFHIFPSRFKTFLNDAEPFNGFLTSMSGDKWKNLRSIITTGFTSGKLKTLSKLINENSDTAVKYLEKCGEIDMKKFYGRFTTDVVCSNFFGINVDSINNPDHPLPKNLDKVFFQTGFKRALNMGLFFAAPSLFIWMNKLNLVSVLDQEGLNYIQSLSKQIIDERRSGKTKRNDFIQMMVDHSETDYETEEGQEIEKPLENLKKTLTDGEILASAILFILAGTDTTANALTWLSYNLAMNPEIQDKLIEEVDSVLEKHKGIVSYESVNEMHYLSDCISETQRIFNVSITDRQSEEDYVLNGYKFKKGTRVVLNLYSVAHDEEVYPDSYKFIPERERPTDKFFPFGCGNRVCVAQRFALTEIKILMASILKELKFCKTEKTVKTPEIDASGLTKPKNTIYLKLVKRQKND